MKSILVLTCCLALGITFSHAEPVKEGKGKGKARQGQAQHVAPQHTGRIGGTKHARVNRQDVNRGGTMNSSATSGAAHHKAAAKHGQFNRAAGTQTDVAAAGQGTKAGRAQVKHYELANARRNNIQSETFQSNRRIVGAENWHGERYVAFRNYHPLWHDHVWWTAHYPRVVLIGGGWYYWNAGFWYPAWGYDTGASFYPYDGPIYGYNELPPDQVVANVQEELQNQGYYHGEVDGMLGPQTRAALADYQRDHDLYTTSAIDQPTMDSLGFS
ncbi:MAG: peptidoglycan-binding protein [Chthoniobacterales bacterium]